MIDCRQLQVFLAIMQTNSFSKAAENIFLTQPTVSGHIKSLEEDLGVTLFDRTSKKVTPTKAAEILYPFALKLLKINKAALREMTMFKGLEKGSLELGGSNIPGQYILPTYINKFKETYAGIKVILKIRDSVEIIDLVADGVLEIGCVGAIIEHKNIVFVSFCEDELVFIIPKDHPLKNKKEVTLNEVMNEKFIIRESGSGTRKSIEVFFKDNGYDVKDLNVVMEIGTTEGVKEAVKAGIGCAIVSKLAVENDLKHKLVYCPKIKDFDIKRKFYLVYSDERTLSPPAEEFKKLLLQ